ncbi:unnamed protein product [Rangifer tarandus platyrhynchus]|uniref:Uncharacterized protein n=2 Tax=Rangifer tarandus platyrhynchus TaxID=3082113 RepID=A0ACB0FAH1_RANTA|nr:unnamed protein product [Rangifer tarandus platyrhynchus]CAI9709056.1 unnamed protein product [Rangifer tarandus platyrhynchus]
MGTTAAPPLTAPLPAGAAGCLPEALVAWDCTPSQDWLVCRPSSSGCSDTPGTPRQRTTASPCSLGLFYSEQEEPDEERNVEENAQIPVKLGPDLYQLMAQNSPPPSVSIPG